MISKLVKFDFTLINACVKLKALGEPLVTKLKTPIHCNAGSFKYTNFLAIFVLGFLFVFCLYFLLSNTKLSLLNKEVYYETQQ